MSANLDLVRSIYAAWGQGDFRRADWADPDIEFVIADGPSPGTWKGLTGMAESVRDYLGVWKDFGMEAEEYRELDRERVLVLLLRRGRGRTSGLDLGQVAANSASVFHIRDGRVTRLVLYFDRERALADLDLAPERGPDDS
jgi:ketosteroid isomerase-like protein